MSDEQLGIEDSATQTSADDAVQSAAEKDSKADLVAILVMFTAAVLMATHFISGLTVDL